ncbi:hypothetical protein LZC95_32310 [Pendulispora brunnea]|uniref:Uncharacterized protein n=1 Tax=Pendulispora brunnea TaxID=2905690 RepID=A0ABZ2JXB1_9BACT
MKRVLLLLAAAGASLGAIMCTGEEPAEVPEVPAGDAGNVDAQTPPPDGGGGGNQPLPKTIAGLALWLDAQDPSFVQLANNVVAKWSDKSGNVPPRDFAPAPGKAAPTFAATALNGKSALSFVQTSQQVLLGPSLKGLSGGEAFIVFQTADNGLFTDAGQHVGYGLWQFGSYNGSHPEFDLPNNKPVIRDGFASTGQAFSGEIPRDDVWKPQIFGAVSTVEAWPRFHNGEQLDGAILDHEVGFNALGSLLGANTAFGDGGLEPTNWFNGVIGEVIIYDHRLPTAQHDAVQKYLSEKWNIPLKDAGP